MHPGFAIHTHRGPSPFTPTTWATAADIYLYTSAISACAKEARIGVALELLDEIEREEPMPNEHVACPL